MWVLELKLQASGGATNAVAHRAVSLAPTTCPYTGTVPFPNSMLYPPTAAVMALLGAVSEKETVNFSLRCVAAAC